MARIYPTVRIFVLVLAILLPPRLSNAEEPFEFVEVPFDDPDLGLATERERLPARGHINALVIFAQFADEAEQGDAVPEWADDLFNPQRPGSFTHFYHTMSFGQLEVQGTVLGKRYTSERPQRAYLAKKAGRLGRYGQFVEEVLRQVDADIDLGAYDNDGPDGRPNSGDDDGQVDFVFVLVRSAPTHFLKDQATGIAGLGMELDYQTDESTPAGQFIRVSSTKARGTVLRSGNYAQTVGVMAHEFGHSLGLPDLYDLGYSGQPAKDSAGIGRWGLMGWGATGWHGTDGPNPLCAWSRAELGWLGRNNEKLVEIQHDARGLPLTSIHQEGVVYKISLGNTFLKFASDFAEEYLLLTYRRRADSYYERNLPADGALIWHARPGRQGNSQEDDKLLDLVCADGLYADAGFPLGQRAESLSGRDNLDFWAHDREYREAWNGNEGDSTDVFDGARFTRLAADTNPSSNFGNANPAYTGPAIEMRPQNDGLSIDIRMPRWAGTIHKTVSWLGPVLVDGDLTIAPEGKLLLFSGAQVRFAGTDRLLAGVDPERCELTVQGGLRVIPIELSRADMGPRERLPFEPVVFEARAQDQSWLGILIADSALVELDDKHYIMRHAEYGLSAINPLLDADAALPTLVEDARTDPDAAYALLPNYPNPFSGTTTLRYTLASPAQVQLKIYNSLGQPVRTLIEAHQAEGTQEVLWDGQSAAGQPVASGLYISRLEVPNGFVASRKMMRLEPGFSTLSDLDIRLRDKGGDWTQIGHQLRRTAGKEFGLGLEPTRAQVAFTLGTEWVNLQVTGQYKEDRTGFRSHGARLAALLAYFNPTPVQQRRIDAFIGQMALPNSVLGPLLAQFRLVVEDILTTDETASLYFYLGEWLQALESAGLLARQLDQAFSVVAQSGPDAAAARAYEAQLRSFKAESALLNQLQDLAIQLENKSQNPAVREAILDILARLDRYDGRSVNVYTVFTEA